MLETPDLSKEFHPIPKPAPREKKKPTAIKPGKRTLNWEDGRKELKKLFAAWGITSCEIRFEGCLRDNFLGFAHVERQKVMTLKEVRSPDKVCLACQQCHQTLDFEMDKKSSKAFMEAIIEQRKSAISHLS